MRNAWKVTAAALVAAVCCAGLSACAEDAAAPKPLSNLDLLAALRDKTGSALMTSRPVNLDGRMYALCAARPSEKQLDAQAGNPHGGFISVSVRGADAKTFADTATPLPAGTVVIKRKIPINEASAAPNMPDPNKTDLYTVMIKREAGYNAESKDWEYAVVSGDGHTVIARGKLESCNECHRIRKETDFLYRKYLKPAGE
jgi:hypothetical protein